MHQSQLAARLTELGFTLDQGAVSRLERGLKPIPTDLLCGLAVALDAPLLALLAPLDDFTVKLAEGFEVSSDQLEYWVQGFGHLPGMDVEQYLEATKGLKIPRRVLERARTEALEEKRARLAERLEEIDKQLGES